MIPVDIKQRMIELRQIEDYNLQLKHKVKTIIKNQDDHFLTDSLKEYREKYLRYLDFHHSMVKMQMNELLNQIDIKDIIPSVYQE